MTNPVNGPNRRKSDRRNVAYTLTYSVEEPYSLRLRLVVPDDINALMLDLSDLGTALLTEHDLPLGTKLSLKFNLINFNLTGERRNKRIKMVGEVVSCISLSKTRYRVSVCFHNISEEDKEAIRVFVMMRAQGNYENS